MNLSIAAGSNRTGPAAAANDLQRLAVVALGQDRDMIRELLSGEAADDRHVSLAELADGLLSDSFAAALITEQALAEDEGILQAAMGRQPSWSEFPFVIISDRSALEPLSSMLSKLGRVTVVERPVHPLSLRTAVGAALQARARQREAASFLVQRQEADEHLRQLTTTLEQRVRERMRDLRAVNDRLMQEIRERRAAEERLRESEELYRHTVELSQQMAWTADRSGRTRSISARFHEITGLPEGKLPRDAMHPDDVANVLERWDLDLETGVSHTAEFRLRMRDGAYRYFRARAAARRDEQGAVLRWYGTIEDVHDQKQADIARREAEERYRLAAKATNDAIWDLDVTASRIQWTASETAFFGYPDSEEMTSLAWWHERVHPEDRRRVEKSLDAAIAGDATRWEESYRFLTARGDYADVVDQGFIIRNEAGVAVRMVGAMSDLTDFRRAEAEIRSIQAELIHVSRLSAMGTMASTLAHELNQPLTAVSSYIRGSRRLLGQQEGGSMETVREALEAAENAALRAGHIVKRLRELVAKGNVSPRPERLAKVIQDASLIAFLDAHLLGASHRIELDPEAEWVEVDPVQIQQVVINLVRNALEAMEGQPRREIVIRTKLLSKGTAEVSVADTGAGIAAEVREALFSPFQSTRVEGMGIGLSISRTIIEAHGGRIWAEDAPGGGTVFRFILPRVQGPEREPEEVSA